MTSRIIRDLRHEQIEDPYNTWARQQLIDRLLHADSHHQPGMYCHWHHRNGYRITAALCRRCGHGWHVTPCHCECPTSTHDLPD